MKKVDLVILMQYTNCWHYLASQKQPNLQIGCSLSMWPSVVMCATGKIAELVKAMQTFEVSKIISDKLSKVGCLFSSWHSRATVCH